MTSQQFRVWPLLSSCPQPRPGASVSVSVSNCSCPFLSDPVTAPSTSLVLNSSKYWLVSLVLYAGQPACCAAHPLTGTNGIEYCWALGIAGSTSGGFAPCTGSPG